MTGLPKIMTIPLGVPVAKALAEGLLHHHYDNLLALSDTHLYLPDRYACRVVRDAFLAASDGKATILPRLLPLGESDDEDLFTTDPYALGDDPSLLPNIDPLERQIILMQLVSKAHNDETLSPAQAFALAGDLAQLIDQAITEDVTLDQLPKLVTGELAKHWEKTMVFLRLIQENWPKIMQERGEWDPTTRRKVLLEKKMAAMRRLKPNYPVIAAGITSHTQQSREFLQLIADLPQGNVVLAGFDPDYPMHYWKHIDPTHAYFGIKTFLDSCGLEPKNIPLWPLLRTKPNATRKNLVYHALQPIENYDLSTVRVPQEEVRSLSFCQSDTLQHEAKAIALILRETIETPNKTAMIVTPDRNLGRRIAHEMRRWDILLHDSGSTPISQSPIAHFFRLILEFCDTARPVSQFLSLCRHPLFQDKQGLDELDLHYLRGSFSTDRLFSLTLPDAPTDLQKSFETTRRHLRFTQKAEAQSLHIWLTQHLEAAEALSGGASHLWRGEEAELLARHFIALRQLKQSHEIILTSQQYREFFQASLENIKLRPLQESHPRLKILSPQEAVMHEADTVILAGLNEKIWPSALPADPWLSQNMRKSLGFPDAAYLQGQAAYRFIQLFCRSHVVLTWSKKREGAMALPSRWLQQIFAVLEKNNIDTAPMHHKAVEWAQEWDRPSTLQPRGAPMPQPDLKFRPKTLAVTDIREWFNDPYSLYAKKILNVKPADEIDHQVGSREWGTLVHGIIEEFLPQINKADAATLYNEIAERHLEEISVEALQKLRWQQQLDRIGLELIAVYQNKNGAHHQEITGQMTRPIGKDSLTIKGRADLVTDENGALTLTDFKTGSLSSKKDILSGKDPQLALLGLIAQENGFAKLHDKSVEALQYVSVKGKLNNILSDQTLTAPQELIDANEERLTAHIDAYYQKLSPYQALQKPGARYDTYEHLKRTAEWALPDTEDDDA